jgi:Flp pilus assembly CpaE family ATPase
LKAGGLNPGYRIEPIQVRRILDYARRNYKIICADLSGNMEDYSLEVLQEATRIFLVVTPEIPSLHLACERLSFLRSMELDSNVGVLVTRAKTLGALPMVEIQRVLGRDLLGAFPNDYNGVHRALTAGAAVSQDTDLGKAFDQFAKSLIEKKPLTVTPRRRFVEYVSLSPVR